MHDPRENAPRRQTEEEPMSPMNGPIPLHVLEGAIELEAEGERWTPPAGALLALDAGITHAVSAPTGGAFLLAVVAVPGGATPDATA
jgi:quercetin dioxygenase-like cupin family protein